MRIFDLLEKQNYESMFNDVLAQNPNDEQLRAQIMDNIAWARKTLKKNDRIIWFLRWAKVMLHPSHRDATMSYGLSGQNAQTVNPALQAYNQRYRTAYTPADTSSGLRQLKMELDHLVSLPIPEIQNRVFGNESPAELLGEFKQYEAAWKQRMEEERSLIQPEEGDEILLQFPDGYAWFLLDRGSCDVEAKAMGHCGNVPSEREGDRILSLRRQVQRGQEVYWYPVATFILDRNNFLGEMKGRNNDKPIEKYHPYIVELLKHDLIEGIKGGGYMPSHNFSMNDLDPKQREELIAQKPSLASFADFYAKEGMTKRVLSMLSDKMSSLGMPDFDKYIPEEKEFELDYWGDLERFTRDIDDEIVNGLVDAAEGLQNQPAFTEINEKQLVEFLDRLPDRTFAEIAASYGIDPRHSHAEPTIARYLDQHRDDLYYRIEAAFEHAYGPDMAKDLDARIREYVNIGWYFEAPCWAKLVNEQDLYNSPVTLRISERELVDLVDAAEQGDDDYGGDEWNWYAQRVISSGSWSVVEWDNLNERRREEGLIGHPKKQQWGNYVDTEYPKPGEYMRDEDEIIDAAVEAFISGRASPTVNDPRQLELPGIGPRSVGPGEEEPDYEGGGGQWTGYAEPNQYAESSFYDDLRHRAGIV